MLGNDQCTVEYILIDILYTPSQTILVIICGSFQYLHNMKKQVKIEEKFKAFDCR